MTQRRLSTLAAGAAAFVIVALIAVLLYSAGSGGHDAGTSTFQQRWSTMGGTQIVLAEQTSSASGISGGQSIAADISIIKRRLATVMSLSDVQITTAAANHLLVVNMAGRPTGQALQLLGQTGEMNIINTGSTVLEVGSDVTGLTCTTSCTPGQYKIVFTGAQLNPNSISASTDPNSNQPIVQFEFQGAAQSDFATYTQNNIGNYLTITLDNKVIESATIQSQITGIGEISGGYMTVAAAQNFASLLKYGAIPVPVHVVATTNVQPGTPMPVPTISCQTVVSTITSETNGTPVADGTPVIGTPTPTPAGSGAAAAPTVPTPTPSAGASCSWPMTPTAEPASTTPTPTPSQ